MSEKPRIENAPGLTWRRHKTGWEALWRARADLVVRGFLPKNQRVWFGNNPTPTEAAAISDACIRLQDEMLVWGRGGTPKVQEFDGTLKSLINCYQTDPDSPHHKKRFHVRKNHDLVLRRLVEGHGHVELAAIKARQILSWHAEWTDGGRKLATGHSFVAQLRTLFSFGLTILESDECERLALVMSKLRFPNSKPRTERLTAEHAEAVRKVAHQIGYASIALAQAIQFDLMLRQKDVIGEWVPISEPGVSDVTWKDLKWLRGIRWSEIDENLILRHVTSKKDKEIVIDLKMAPMVMAELALWPDYMRRKDGPLVICEATARPWGHGDFRRKWRVIADIAGIPKTVKNMDSRAGAISEATDAGAELEHVRHAATHSDISMTQRYSRGSEDKIAQVQRLRIEHRNKGRTDKT